MNRLSSTLPGIIAAPLEPPFCQPDFDSKDSPPPFLTPEWQRKHRLTSIGRTFFSKKDSSRAKEFSEQQCKIAAAKIGLKSELEFTTIS
jgi:hypothetical protein